MYKINVLNIGICADDDSAKCTMNTYFDGFSTGTKGRHGPDRMVVELKLHYAIGTYIHWCCGSDFRSWPMLIISGGTPFLT
jgi:hypothetical protein